MLINMLMKLTQVVFLLPIIGVCLNTVGLKTDT